MGRSSLCYFTFDLTGPFGQTLLQSVSNRCKQRGIDLFVVHGSSLDPPDEGEKRRNALYRWASGEVFDAFLIANIFSFVGREAAIRFLEPLRSRPMVTMAEKIPGIPVVRVDNTTGFRELLLHLLADRNKHSYAVIAGPPSNADCAERFAAMSEVMAKGGVALEPARIVYSAFDETSAENGIRVLLDERKTSFDTLICFNDHTAIAAMEELKRRGLKMPGDVRVTGFDNSYESGFAGPPLSTVEQPIGALGEKGVDLIADLLLGREVPESITLPTRFIPRQSSGVSASTRRTAPSMSAPSDAGLGGRIGERFAAILSDAKSHSQVSISEKDERTFAQTAERAVERFFGARVPGVGEAIEFLESLAAETAEWGPPLWSAFFDLLYLSAVELAGGGSGKIVEALAAAREAALMRHYRFLVTRHIKREIEERYLIQIGEVIATAFDLSRISKTLEQYCPHIGIDTCFIVVYADKAMGRARLLVRIEQGVERDAEEFGEFDPGAILPAPLMEAYPSLVMEALQVRDEDLGYMLFNLGDYPGILYKSLRHQISSAVKGARLITTINSYSEGLEVMVRERTARLRELNEAMKAEITWREQAERELLKQKNFESLGQLAGGIAHDFNNILTAISGNLSLLTLEEEDAATRRSRYESMIKAVGNAKYLTQQLLTFSKGGAPIKKAMAIAPLVRETAEFVLRGTNVKPEFHFPSDVCNAEIDANQISQVVNNLVLNAAHAMPDGGTISFTVDSVLLTRADERPRILPGRYVRISIADRGHGISPEIIDKIFDPYFTTKEKGSGLGLSTSLAIVGRHGGDIVVSSAIGEGTVFLVYLPASDQEAAAPATSSVPSVPSGLRVLVMDDDPQVVRVLSAFLSKTGQDFVTTSEGAGAVECYASAIRSGSRFDLVIMDLTIPGGMGGLEAMAAILHQDPDARGIVSSGYSEVPVLADYARYGFRAMLKKPFTLEEFKKAVNEALSP